MKTFNMDIDKIQPTQLYINKKKLNKNRKLNKKNSNPIPVKKIGSHILYTDGHTRALNNYFNGETSIKVYWDTDNLDWYSYLICLNWANEENIYTIKNLKNRIISNEKYKELWLNKCTELHEKINANKHYKLNIKIINNKNIKQKIASEILKALPEWFGIEEALKDYVEGVKDKVLFAAFIGQIPVGFFSIKEHNKFTNELYVLGIYKEFHNHGIGKKLLKECISYSHKQEKKYLTVKTLSKSHPDNNYAKTRIFYEKMGFKPLEEFKNLWGPENPCLYMIKNL